MALRWAMTHTIVINVFALLCLTTHAVAINMATLLSRCTTYFTLHIYLTLSALLQATTHAIVINTTTSPCTPVLLWPALLDDDHATIINMAVCFILYIYDLDIPALHHDTRHRGLDGWIQYNVCRQV